MADVIDILIEAKNLISEEKNWVQGMQAADKDGNEVLPHWDGTIENQPAAVKW